MTAREATPLEKELVRLQLEHTILHRKQSELTHLIIENQKAQNHVIHELRQRREAGLVG